MKKAILFTIPLGIIIGFFAPIFYYTANAEMNYQTGIYLCTNEGTDLSGYDIYDAIAWNIQCEGAIRLDGMATENQVIIECSKNIGTCGNSTRIEEEASSGFILEFLYQKGTLPDDYILQLSFIILLFILSFFGTMYLIKKII